MNVLTSVIEEKNENFKYADERICSTIYLASLSYSLRSLENITDPKRREEKRKRNSWLLDDTKKAMQVATLNFDRVSERTGIQNRKSCDVLFYDFERQDDHLHYIGEMKCVSKRMMVRMLKSDGKDGIYEKVHNSIKLIESELLFSGSEEGSDIVQHLHFFIVYDGKNDMVSLQENKMPKRQTEISRKNGRQIHASRQRPSKFSKKVINEIYEKFSGQLKNLGLHNINEDIFHMCIDPQAKADKAGRGKYRMFSIFSADDFKELLRSGFFDNWNWGRYAG